MIVFVVVSFFPQKTFICIGVGKMEGKGQARWRKGESTAACRCWGGGGGGMRSDILGRPRARGRGVMSLKPPISLIMAHMGTSWKLLAHELNSPVFFKFCILLHSRHYSA